MASPWKRQRSEKGPNPRRRRRAPLSLILIVEEHYTRLVVAYTHLGTQNASPYCANQVNTRAGVSINLKGESTMYDTAVVV